jgi:hypothetical protein
MTKKEITSKSPPKINFGTILTGGLIGFLGAAVLYRKHFPTWVPSIFVGSPLAFFSLFIIVCGILGYIWSITEDA